MVSVVTPIGLSEILTFLFIMVGPSALLSTFARVTANASDKERKRLAWSTIGFATLSLLIAAFLGSRILVNWHVSPGALLIAGGAILFLVAVLRILRLPVPSHDSQAPADSSKSGASIIQAGYSAIVTPYGIAVLICSMSLQPKTTALILAALLIIMALDLVVMLYAKSLWHSAAPIDIVGAILSILQVALSVQIIFSGFQLLIRETR